MRDFENHSDTDREFDRVNNQASDRYGDYNNGENSKKENIKYILPLFIFWLH